MPKLLVERWQVSRSGSNHAGLQVSTSHLIIALGMLWLARMPLSTLSLGADWTLLMQWSCGPCVKYLLDLFSSFVTVYFSDYRTYVDKWALAHLKYSIIMVFMVLSQKECTPLGRVSDSQTKPASLSHNPMNLVISICIIHAGRFAWHTIFKSGYFVLFLVHFIVEMCIIRCIVFGEHMLVCFPQCFDTVG